MATSPGDKPRDLSALKIDDRDRMPRGRRRRWPIAVVLGVLVIAVLLILSGNRPVEVECTAVKAVDDTQPYALLNASGYVTPRRRATVAAKITGRVEQVLFDEGLVVEEGQVLATIDSAEASRRLAAAERERDVARAQVKDFEVNLANARIELRRAEELRKSGFGSEQALDAARTLADSLSAKLALTQEQIRAAEAQVAIYRQDLDNCTIRAPFAGIIVSKDAQRGEMVSPISAGGGFTRTGIATVVDMQSLEIEVDVNEAFIAKVHPEQKVEATLDAYPDWKMSAKVRTVIPTADRQKATVKVRITFDQLDPRILPDMGVKVGFLSDPGTPGSGAGQVLLAPKAAVREDNGQSYVFVLQDARLAKRAVTAGAQRQTDVEIKSGLSAGEQVVVAGPQVMKDGQKAATKKGR